MYSTNGSLLSCKHMSQNDILKLFIKADIMKTDLYQNIKDKILINVFFEASTRTSLSLTKNDTCYNSYTCIYTFVLRFFFFATRFMINYQLSSFSFWLLSSPFSQLLRPKWP